DEDGAPRYGMEDESSKLNINVVDATVLNKLPQMESGLAEAVVAMRGQEPFRDLKDLLQIEGIDAITLYGEDQNENGLLDANENDGDQSWPPDDANGWLDTGLSRYLTTWSAALDLSAEGNARVDLTQDDAETITQEIKDISQQQADSIVARRESGGFSSVLDLLEVELVEMTQEQPQEGERRREKQEEPAPQANEKPSQGKKDEQKASSGKGNSKEGGTEEKPGQNAEGEEPKDSEKPKQQPKTVAKGTGQKAFDESTVRKIADLMTISKEDVRKGLVNINTAPYEVLACLPGMDETLAEAIVRERDTRAGGFTTVIDLLDVNGMTVDKLKQCYEMMTARSDVFTVRSYGVIDGGAVCVAVGAVIDRSDETIHILHWQEYE
ncbi:MAG: helix-hairpin-helix domain-containing protein, partial [Candidatus Hydrogenedentes bacterium]|nr:helix-hairpin-helix domain-containing protein [Candidatus Hydrogenedentota bacterium]